MGDNDEVMRFEITDQDLEDEITISFGMKMSKNQTTWDLADNSDSERPVEPKAGVGTNRGKRNFNTIFGFVSGGIVWQK